MTPETPLVRILRERGKRQDWVARQIPVHPSTFSRWVTGRRELPAHYLPRLAEILEVTEDQLKPKEGELE